MPHAAAQEIIYAEFLEQVPGEEVAAKATKNIAMRARFPFKAAAEFDFGYQPSIDSKQVWSLASGQFIEHGDNVIVPSPRGMGKTHLVAGSLGLKAIEAGYRVLFPSVVNLIAARSKAHAEG